MARAELNPENPAEIILETEYRERHLTKQVPGARYDKELGGWRVPYALGPCYAMAGIYGQSLEIGPRLKQSMDASWISLIAHRHELRAMTDYQFVRRSEMDPVMELLGPLQRVGSGFLTHAGRALLADEMGTGKTVQTIVAIRAIAGGMRPGPNENSPSPLPILVVCPNSMKLTWEREFKEWWPELVVSAALGTAAKRRKAIARVASGEAQVLVMNWESFWRHTSLTGFGKTRATEKEKEPKELNSIQWATVVADESHRAKDGKSKQTRGLWSVSRGARYRFALTGTPVEKSPDQLWPQLHFVSPDDWPTKGKFIDRYCAQGFSPWSEVNVIGLNPQHRDEFYAVLDPMYLRRPKEAILPGLPPKRRQTRIVEMGTKQARAYRQMQKEMLVELDNGILMARSPLSLVTRLSQLASGYGEIGMEEESDGEGKLLITEPSNKVDALLDVLDEAGDQQQVVVFAESRTLIGLCETALSKRDILHGVIAGDRNERQRQDAVDRFQAGELRVMLCTYGAGSEGITLTAASVCVMLQRAWSSIKNRQAEDRVHRRGSEVHDEILIIDVVSDETIDLHRLETFEEKMDDAAELLRDEETLMRLLGKE